MVGVRGVGMLTALLIGVDFLDEWSSGIPAVASPDLQREFGVSYGMAAGWVLTAFGLLAVIVEPPIFVLADRYPRRWFVCGGLGALGAVCVAAGFAPSYGWLLVALLLFGPASASSSDRFAADSSLGPAAWAGNGVERTAARVMARRSFIGRATVAVRTFRETTQCRLSDSASPAGRRAGPVALRPRTTCAGGR